MCIIIPAAVCFKSSDGEYRRIIERLAEKGAEGVIQVALKIRRLLNQ